MKLAAGIETLEELQHRQSVMRRMARRDRREDVVVVGTRNMPRRREEILSGGSIYWIFKGAMQCRQKILAIEEGRGSDGRSLAHLVLDPDLVMVRSVPRKPFQGWRYLDDPPPDIARGAHMDAAVEMPEEMRRELARIGVL